MPGTTAKVITDLFSLLQFPASVTAEAAAGINPASDAELETLSAQLQQGLNSGDALGQAQTLLNLLKTIETAKPDISGGEAPSPQTTLTANVEGGNDPSSALLIALGFTPSQLADIAQRIEEVETRLGRDLTAEDIVAGVGGIIPVPAPVVPVQQVKASITSAAIVPDSGEPTDDLAAQLNGLSVGGSEDGELELEVSSKPLDASHSVGTGNADMGGKGNANILKSAFAAMLQMFNGGSANADVKTDAGALLPVASAPDALDIQIGLPLTQAMQAAHASTSVAHAGHTHPATQMVAATLTKAAANGSSSEMTIQLDPPELGRVDVRLEFGNDHSVKAHLLVEKAETYMMLQRDSFILDRALQSAGLDVTGGGVSFELATDSGSFGNERNGDGTGGGNGNTGGETAQDEIETTMNWAVDPETGHVRYSIFA